MPVGSARRRLSWRAFIEKATWPSGIQDSRQIAAAPHSPFCDLQPVFETYASKTGAGLVSPVIDANQRSFSSERKFPLRFARGCIGNPAGEGSGSKRSSSVDLLRPAREGQ